MNEYSFAAWALGILITVAISLGVVLVRSWGKQGIMSEVQERQEALLKGQTIIQERQGADIIAQGRDILDIKGSVKSLTATADSHSEQLKEIRSLANQLLIGQAEAKGEARGAARGPNNNQTGT